MSKFFCETTLNFELKIKFQGMLLESIPEFMIYWLFITTFQSKYAYKFEYFSNVNVNLNTDNEDNAPE